MTLEPSIETLASAKAGVSQRWESLKLLWADSVRQQFERDFWEPLDREVEATLGQMTVFADILDEAGRTLANS